MNLLASTGELQEQVEELGRDQSATFGNAKAILKVTCVSHEVADGHGSGQVSWTAHHRQILAQHLTAEPQLRALFNQGDKAFRRRLMKGECAKLL